MKQIKLINSNLVASVDDNDYDYLTQWNWRLGTKGYAESKVFYKTVGMHRLIMMTMDRKKETDHIDHNKLNNQRSNLRCCTTSQNQMNKNPRGTSRYLGVKIVKGKVKAAIKIQSKYLSLGTFKTEEDAARSYDEAAKIYHGEFANLNFK